MNPQAAFRELLSTRHLDGRRTSVTLVGVKDAEGKRDHRRVQMHPNLREEFEGHAIQFFTKNAAAQAEGDVQLAEYEPGERPDAHQVRYARISTDPILSAFFESLPEAGATDVFVRDDKILKKLRFFIVTASAPGSEERIRMFHTMSKGKVLTQTHKIVATLSGDKFESAQDSNPLMFDPKFQVVVYDDYAFIFSVEGYHQVFDYYQGMKAHGEETLDKIQETLPVAGFEAFKLQALKNKPRLKKLRDIALKGRIHHVTMDKIKETIKNYGLDVKIVVHDGIEKILFDDKNVDEILELFEDQFVLSEMTGSRYKANSKREIKAKSTTAK